MRIFLSALILIFSFQSWIKADDIRDFQIEGMSIGDSALDYFSEKEILDNIENYYNYDDFKVSEISGLEEFIKFKNINFHFKKNDRNYKIAGISGFTFYKKNIQKCYSDMEVIDNEINSLFNNLERIVGIKEKHEADKSGKSTTKAIRYWFQDDSLISIVCYDWSDELTNENRWTDNLTIEITSNELNKWLLKIFE